MKAKFMALLLSAGLGVTGIAVTAQAAGDTEALSGCTHERVTVITRVKEATNWDGMRHYVVYETQYCCPGCKQVIDTEYNATYEPHDYEQIYYDSGTVMSYCTVCDDCYFW